MKRICFIITLPALLLLSACRTAKPSESSPPVILNRSDSIHTEYIRTVRIDTVTVEVPVPAESAKQVVPDSTSHLETSMAESDAWINADGTLGHSIKNKGQPVKAKVPVPVKDTQTNKSSENIKEVPVPYYVEKKVFIETPLSAWQKFRIHSFWFLAVTLTASLIYIFRKPLLRLLCRLRL